MAANERRYPPIMQVTVSKPDTPASGGVCRFGAGGMVGIAVDNENADGKTVVDFTPGKVWSLSVRGHDGTSNAAIAAGDKVYYVDDNAYLNVKASGSVFFGYALEAVSSGVTATILVMKA